MKKINQNYSNFEPFTVLMFKVTLHLKLKSETHRIYFMFFDINPTYKWWHGKFVKIVFKIEHKIYVLNMSTYCTQWYEAYG